MPPAEAQVAQRGRVADQELAEEDVEQGAAPAGGIAEVQGRELGQLDVLVQQALVQGVDDGVQPDPGQHLLEAEADLLQRPDPIEARTEDLPAGYVAPSAGPVPRDKRVRRHAEAQVDRVEVLEGEPMPVPEALDAGGVAMDLVGPMEVLDLRAITCHGGQQDAEQAVVPLVVLDAGPSVHLEQVGDELVLARGQRQNVVSRHGLGSKGIQLGQGIKSRVEHPGPVVEDHRAVGVDVVSLGIIVLWGGRQPEQR